MLRLRLLGSIEAEVDGRTVPISSPTQRAVLVALARRPGHTVSRDRLAASVWGDRPPAKAAAALKSHVSRLRRVLRDDVIEARGDGYALTSPPGAVDTVEFTERVRDARTEADLAAALDLWRGVPFAECGTQEWMAGEVRRLRELRLHALERLAERLAAMGRHDEAIARLEEVVGEEPLREPAWMTLIQVCSACGRHADALGAASRYRDHVRDAGLVPSARFDQVEREAYAAPAASTSPLGTRPIPAPLTELVGRATEVDDLVSLLGDRRLVSLIGPGGVGKTTLALAAARRVADEVEGAWLASLAEVEDGAEVPSTVARAVGATAVAPVAKELRAHLSGRPSLIVLDNAEHVHAAVADLAADLVTGVPDLRLLVTSRRPLGIPGEVIVDVPALDPASAVALFWQRAADTGAPVDAEHADLVATLCDRLDGLPLAIEMAAGRLRTIPLPELVDRLDGHPDLLGSHGRPADRHRTLSRMMAWSHDLLDGSRRALLGQLSVFAGPFSLPVAEEVCDIGQDVAPALGDLVDSSLVQREGPDRYRLLHTIRQYAAEQLERRDHDDVVTRFVRQHAALATELAVELRGSREPEAARRFESHVPNLAAAHARALERDDPDAAAAIAAAAFGLVYQRLRADLGVWAERTLPHLPGDHEQRSAVVATAAARYLHSGAPDTAHLLLEGLPAEPGARFGELVLGDLCTYAGDLDAAVAAFERSGRLARVAGDRCTELMADASRALAVGYGGDLDGALAIVRTGWGAAVEAGLGLIVTWFDYAEGELLAESDADRALALLDEVIATADDAGWSFLGGVAWLTATTIRSRTDATAALPAFGALIEHWDRRDDAPHQWTTLRNLVPLLTSLGAAEAAATLLGAVGAAPHRTYGPEEVRLDRSRHELEAVLGPGLDRARRAGARLDRQGAVAVARRAIGELSTA